MSEKRRGLGRGLGALIPPGAGTGAATRPVDVFFKDRVDEQSPTHDAGDTTESPDGVGAKPGPDAPTAAVEDTTGETGETPTAAPTATDNEDDAADGVLRPVPGARFAEIPLDSIRPNPRQPRTVFDEDELAELVHSVREVGVMQPIVVRPIPVGADAPEGVEFELIMGERRWRASREAEKATVPAIVKETDDDDLLRDALLENLHRSELNALEEAAAYQQLLDDFGCTQEELATRIGRSRPQVSNTLRLLKLPPTVGRRVAAGVLSAGHARALLGAPDGAAMERLAQRVVAEGLSVRTVEEIVALGGDEDQSAAPRRPRAGGRNPQLDDIAADLSDRLETRVGISLGKRRGKVTIDFASIEDLNRILDTMHLRETS